MQDKLKKLNYYIDKTIEVGNRRNMWYNYDKTNDNSIKIELIKSKLMHIVTEVSEAYKELDKETYKNKDKFIEEMADVVLVTFGIIGKLELKEEFINSIYDKIEKNLTRKD